MYKDSVRSEEVKSVMQLSESMFTPPFKNVESLLEFLMRQSTDFPLIQKLYIPIIEEHFKRYSSKQKNYNINDWLLIPTFQSFWAMQDEQLKPVRIAHLEETEKRLKLIKQALGDVGFENLCQSFFKKIADKSINGVHDKLCDFFAEKKAIVHFFKQSYSIMLIPEGKKKTADFLAKKDQDEVIVECKFVHKSNRVQTFIDRQINYWSNFYNEWSGDKIGRATKSVLVNPINSSLSSDDIYVLKKFITQIVQEKTEKKELTIERDTQIIFERKDQLESSPVTLDNWGEYLASRLKEFFDIYINRRIDQANEQIKSTIVDYQRSEIYILIELDKEYGNPFLEVKDKMREVKNNFEKEHKLKIILETFPEI